METRVLLSANLVDHAVTHAAQHHAAQHQAAHHPASLVEHTNVEFVRHHSSASPNGNGYTPAQIQTAYQFNKVSFSSGLNGTGQTIAIVDAYDDPTIKADLTAFDAAFGLPNPPNFTVMSQTGSTTNLPPADPGPKSDDWEIEEALDVEWAHALAPGANIVLVEANDASGNLFTAVQTAANLPGVSVVSMSWGGDEFSSEASLDSYFKTATGHQGVTFVASTGDSGEPSGYPAFSPNVLAVGGTSLNITSNGTYTSEAGWSGSGGSVSLFESQPTYQNGIVKQSSTRRANPDVSFDADPNTGVPILDSFSFGSSKPWIQVGGTSFAAPSWAAIIAIADQGRAQNGLGTLDGVSQTLPMLYSLDKTSPSAFHDVTTGSNGLLAGTGYDLVTGIGSPLVDQVVAGLSGSSQPTGTQLAFQQAPSTGTAGTALGTIKVAVEDQNGQVLTSDNSTVTISVSSGPGTLDASSTLTAKAVNGIATFSNVVLDTVGTYKLQANDGSDTAATSGNIVISAGQAAKLAFQQVPVSGTVGAPLGTVSVLVQDQFGNSVTTSSTVTISVASGPGTLSGTMSASSVNGLATFTNLILSAAGTYTLKASDGAATSSTSTSISVTGGVSLLAPQNVVATALSATSAQLTWSPSVGATGYRVFSVVSGTQTLIATVSSSTTLYTITGLAAGSTNSFQVEAFNSSSKADSSVVSVTLPNVVALGAPQVTGVALSATSAQLNWAPIGGVLGYRVYYWNGSQPVLLGTVSPTTTSFRTSGLTPGGTYQFLVESFDGSTIADSNWVIVKLPYSGVGHR